MSEVPVLQLFECLPVRSVSGAEKKFQLSLFAVINGEDCYV
jgi:hypothetical protein